MNLRITARELFMETLKGLDITKAMQRRLICTADEVVIGERRYSLRNFRRVIVIAIGKAAGPMTDALLLQLRPSARDDQRLEGVVVSSFLPEKLDRRFQYFQGDHPLPGLASRRAAHAVLELLSTCDAACLVFFLISGGASAMIEYALDDRFSVEDTAAFHRALVHSGLPITKMNVLRKHFSRVKGGRLAVAAQGATQCTLLISDVPHDALHIVGSGPSLPDPSTVEECRQILQSSNSALPLTQKTLDFFCSSSLEETPKGNHPAFDTSMHISLLSSDDLCELASEAAAMRGFHVEVDNSCDDWCYRDAAKHLLERLEQLRNSHERVCLISAGEVSVQLPSQHGTGGRNQQLVLECARLLGERKQTAAVLSGGSDGADGNSSAAGAVCDETTCARAAAQGIDLDVAIEQFDSATVFAALGDTVVTGPTGNNVRDLRILLSRA